MKFSSLVAAGAIALLAGETDARMGFGNCPVDIKFQTIDQSKWAGTWYEIQRDILFPFEIGAECVTSVYRPNAEGGMDYYYRGYYW
jgi:lipocalin